MKKLISTIVIVLTLISCSTEEQESNNQSNKTAVEELWVKYVGTTTFVFTGTIRPLQPINAEYSDCEMWAGTTPPNSSSGYIGSEGNVYRWRIACR